jgi:rare lipoprotein A
MNLLIVLLAARMTATPLPHQVAATPLPQVGYATWYSAPSGAKTASGEVFNPNKLTAAHRSLPFGTCVDVVRLTVDGQPTGQKVRVRITDRGPFGKAERIIDLSYAAADKLGISKAGVGKVRLRRSKHSCR